MMTIGSPSPDSAPALMSTPLLRLGFRPFYLFAALFALLGIPAWLLSYSGTSLPMPAINLLWHVHEMVFGFASAVVVGFLFTAARNWTGLWTPRDWPLAGFAGLWVLGRIGVLLLAAASVGVANVSASTAMHAIALGGMSSLILGMITRTTLGHTGRVIRADHHELAIFIAIQCAAGARILANLAPPELRNALLTVAALAWVLAFGVYLAVFGPILCAPRIDGRDG